MDPHGENNPDGMFSLFCMQVARELAPKLAVIFRHLIRGGSFPQSWAHLYRDTFALLLFVKVSEHCVTSKYHDESIGAGSTIFMDIISFPM